jgi:hypothetical protein
MSEYWDETPPPEQSPPRHQQFHHPQFSKPYLRQQPFDFEHPNRFGPPPTMPQPPIQGPAMPYPPQAVPYRALTKSRTKTSHTFHLIMTLCTCSVWAWFVWIPMILWHKFGPKTKTVTHYR